MCTTRIELVRVEVAGLQMYHSVVKDLTGAIIWRSVDVRSATAALELADRAKREGSC